MIKKIFTFEDVDGNPVTEEYLFRFTKAELAEKELGYDGGYSKHIEKILETKNNKLLIETFKQLIMDTVGKRSESNKFIKNADIRAEFMDSDAYAQLFWDVCTDANYAAEFLKGVMPNDIQDQLQDIQLPDENAPKAIDDPRPAYQRENRNPTSRELQAMTPEEMAEAFAWRERSQ